MTTKNYARLVAMLKTQSPPPRMTAETYLRSRDFRIKNRLRAFLITANSSIKCNNREVMTRSNPSTTTIPIPFNLKKKLLLDEQTFFVREDFMRLLEEVNCKIKHITVTMDTGDKSKGEVQNTVHLHIESYGMDQTGEPYDLGIQFDFLHMPLCGMPNLIINSQLLDHINDVILKRFSEIESFH